MEEPRIKLTEPEGKFGRWGQVVVTVAAICLAMGSLNVFISDLLEVEVRELSLWIRLTIFLAVSVLIFLFKMTTFGDDEEEESLGPPANARSSVEARTSAE